MATNYKEPKAYKGFEQWWHEYKMTRKMYVKCFFYVFILYILVGIILWPISIKDNHLGFILALPVWLLYPKWIKKFKKRAEKATQDEHLRGTKLISDVELAKIISKEIEIKEKGGIL